MHNKVSLLSLILVHISCKSNPLRHLSPIFHLKQVITNHHDATSSYVFLFKSVG